MEGTEPRTPPGGGDEFRRKIYLVVVSVLGREALVTFLRWVWPEGHW